MVASQVLPALTVPNMMPMVGPGVSSGPPGFQEPSTQPSTSRSVVSTQDWMQSACWPLANPLYGQMSKMRQSRMTDRVL